MLSNRIMQEGRRDLSTIVQIGQTWEHIHSGETTVDIVALDPRGNIHLRYRSTGQTDTCTALYLFRYYFLSTRKG